MRKIAFLSLVVILAITAGVKPSPARSATPAALLDALPDGTAVAVIDFQKIAGSSLWATINSQDKLRSEIDKAQGELANLGVTLSGVHTVALVFSAGLKSPTVAVSGGFDQDVVLERLRANPRVSLTSEKYKGIDIYKAKAAAATADSKDLTATGPARTGIGSAEKDGTSFVFYDASTMVAGNSQAVRASVDVKTGASPGLSQNSQLSDALAQNPAAAIRFALTITPAMTSGLKSGNLPVDFSTIRLIFGSIDVGSGIDLNATLRSDTTENAKSMSEKLNALLTAASTLMGSTSDPKMASIAEALKSVTITTAEADVKITGSLPTALLNSLVTSATKK